MQNKLNIAPFAVVVAIAVILQLILIGADGRQTPAKIAKNFAEAYYALDAEMQDYMCGEPAEKSAVVENFLSRKENEAAQRGLSTNYLRHEFTHLHITVTPSGDKTMEVHLTGTTRVCINPVFMRVGKLFRIGKNYPVNETFELEKENDQWRVCGNPFGLRSQV